MPIQNSQHGMRHANDDYMPTQNSVPNWRRGVDVIGKEEEKRKRPLKARRRNSFFSRRRARQGPFTQGLTTPALLLHLAGQDFLYLAGQLFEAERLGEEMHHFALAQLFTETVFGVAGDEDHLGIRFFL